ncbi:MAG TPA: hypothetical protein VFD24_07885 [Chitinophagaceae bacterium]|jgi:hypothetical protein|nr:hypothetical protein [Chitinophagaceae bacterium]
MGAGKHLHPCPVVGYIVSGKVLFQVEGEEKKTLNQGEAFYEQQNKTIYISTMPLRRRRLFLSHSI